MQNIHKFLCLSAHYKQTKITAMDYRLFTSQVPTPDSERYLFCVTDKHASFELIMQPLLTCDKRLLVT